MTLRRTISHIGPLQIAIIVLAVVTALVHLDRGLSMTLLASHTAGPGHFSGPPPTGRPGGVGGAGHFSGPPAGGFGLMSFLPFPLSTLFFLNFAAYIILVAALYLPPFRQFQRIIRWLLIALAVVTVLVWFLISGGIPNPLGYADKVVEIALIVLLIIEGRQASLNRG